MISPSPRPSPLGHATRIRPVTLPRGPPVMPPVFRQPTVSAPPPLEIGQMRAPIDPRHLDLPVVYVAGPYHCFTVEVRGQFGGQRVAQAKALAFEEETAALQMALVKAYEGGIVPVDFDEFRAWARDVGLGVMLVLKDERVVTWWDPLAPTPEQPPEQPPEQAGTTTRVLKDGRVVTWCRPPEWQRDLPV
jgi:hypothetical protein